MGNNSDDTIVSRWDRCLDHLSEQIRRQIITSLMEAPPERRLPLPNAALTENHSVTPDELIINLVHHHLPEMADADYIRWKRDPFCVRRGPRFEEPAGMMRALFSSKEQLPPSLRADCLEEH